MKMYLTKYILVLFFVISVIAVPQSAYTAESVNLPKNAINPGDMFYPVKRLAENILFKLQFTTSAKLDFHKKLIQTRLAELNYVAEGKKADQSETSSQRFAYQTGILSDFIISNKLDKEKYNILQTFEQYKPMIAKMRDLYPANSSYWMLLQQDIDTLNLNAVKLK